MIYTEVTNAWKPGEVGEWEMKRGGGRVEDEERRWASGRWRERRWASGIWREEVGEWKIERGGGRVEDGGRRLALRYYDALVPSSAARGTC